MFWKGENVSVHLNSRPDALMTWVSSLFSKACRAAWLCDLFCFCLLPLPPSLPCPALLFLISSWPLFSWLTISHEPLLHSENSVTCSREQQKHTWSCTASQQARVLPWLASDKRSNAFLLCISIIMAFNCYYLVKVLQWFTWLVLLLFNFSFQLVAVRMGTAGTWGPSV